MLAIHERKDLSSHEKIRLLLEERVQLKMLNKSIKDDAARILACYEAMKGEVVMYKDCVKKLKDQDPETHERFFGKAARNERKRERG